MTADLLQGKVCMVVFSNYPDDPRVRRDAEALERRGMEVDIVCLREPGEPAREVVKGVNVHRLPVRRKRTGKLRYIYQYASFIGLAAAHLARHAPSRRWDVVHAHNMPDLIVAAAAVPKLMGAKVVLDLHDPMPEVYMSKYGLAENHPAIRCLLGIERWAMNYADHCITANEAFRVLFVSRGCPVERLGVVLNSPDESVFGDWPEPRMRPVGEGPFRLMYHGTIVERHGLDSLLQAVAALRAEDRAVELVVYGEGDFVQEFLRRRDELGLAESVDYRGRVPLEEIARVIPEADLGVIPNKRYRFTELNLPTRILEYLSKGVPVVAPDTRGVRDYFNDGTLYFFEPGNAGSLTQTIRRAMGDPAERQSILGLGRVVALRHAWASEQEKLVAIYRDLLVARGVMHATQNVRE
ncbi:MAG: glycosyltransferase family 4 protein [Desulfocurvibacter africanus]